MGGGLNPSKISISKICLYRFWVNIRDLSNIYGTYKYIQQN